jgi:Mlc titration factor MtfA (ptsG expression regulator)
LTALLYGTLLLALAGFGILGWRQHRQQAQRRLQPLPAAQRALLAQRLPHYARLDPAQRERLHAQVQCFLAEKDFHGCNGLAVTAEMRVLIAGLACLLVLRPDARPFPRLKSVLVYPEAFWVHHPEPDELGLVSDEPVLQIGESWSDTRVVLSWADVEAALAGDETNVVAHEFAHQLDDEDTAEGAPRLADYRRWSQVMRAAFDELRAQGSPVLDDYGAEGPGEFFAVATESYFQRGAELRAHHPELYALLRDYYQIDTAPIDTAAG